MSHAATTIHMVRHTDVHNPEGIIYGRLPRFRLSRFGSLQAEETAEYLKQSAVSALYSSPQLRARQTAEILNRALCIDRVSISSLICEVGTAHQGSSNKVLGPKLNFYDNPASDADETISMVAGRMRRFLAKVARRHAGQKVVAVSHADPIMILRVAMENRPLVHASLSGDNYPAKGSVTTFTFRGDELTLPIEYRSPVSSPEPPDSETCSKE
jgi:broad specificity phosphatase PhoE